MPVSPYNFVEFGQTDGLPPSVVSKLNYNFRTISGLNSVGQSRQSRSEESGVNAAVEAETARIAAYNASSYASKAFAYLLDVEDDWEAIQQYEEDARDKLSSINARALDASAAALVANEHAVEAGIGLSMVEQVIGTLTWIEDHGTYVSQAGEQYDPDRVYYERIYVYSLTQDTVIDEYKTYYTRSGQGTEEDPYVYTPVANPVLAELPTYYEVTDILYHGVVDPVPEAIDSYYVLEISESVQNYLASHLDQTDYGLNIMFDGTTDYIHIGTVDGTYDSGVYLFVSGGIRSAYTEYGASIGPESSFHVVVTNTALNFYQGAALVAYVNNNELNIPSAVVERSVIIGNWMLAARPSGNLGIFYVG